jgi:hypothetical protein
VQIHAGIFGGAVSVGRENGSGVNALNADLHSAMIAS